MKTRTYRIPSIYILLVGVFGSIGCSTLRWIDDVLTSESLYQDEGPYVPTHYDVESGRRHVDVTKLKREDYFPGIECPWWSGGWQRVMDLRATIGTPPPPH